VQLRAAHDIAGARHHGRYCTVGHDGTTVRTRRRASSSASASAAVTPTSSPSSTWHSFQPYSGVRRPRSALPFSLPRAALASSTSPRPRRHCEVLRLPLSSRRQRRRRYPCGGVDAAPAARNVLANLALNPGCPPLNFPSSGEFGEAVRHPLRRRRETRRKREGGRGREREGEGGRGREGGGSPVATAIVLAPALPTPAAGYSPRRSPRMPYPRTHGRAPYTRAAQALS